MTKYKKGYTNRFCRNCNVYRVEYTLLLIHILMMGKITGFTFRPPDGETTPVPTIVDNHNNATTILGGRAELKCVVLNLGTKTVTWRRANEKQPITIGLLTFDPDKRFQVTNIPHKDEWNLYIKDVKKKDAGVYECQISSKDRSIRQQVHLTVRELKPGIKISDTTYVEKGDKIVLTCNATADDIDWFKQGQKVVTDLDNRVSISKNEYVMQGMITSVLEIEKATMEDDSDYVCRSSNLKTDNVKVHVLNAGRLKEKRDFVEPTISNVSTVKSAGQRATMSLQLFGCILLTVVTPIIFKYSLEIR